MNEEFNLEDFINEWKAEYGTDGVSKAHGTPYKYVDKLQREEFFHDFLKTAKEKGKEEFYFKRFDIKKQIVEACFPPVIHDADKRKRGIKAVESQYLIIVAHYFKMGIQKGDIEATRTKEYDPKKGPLAKPLDRSAIREEDKPIMVEDPEAAALLGFTDGRE